MDGRHPSQCLPGEVLIFLLLHLCTRVVDMNTDRGEVFLKNPKNTSEDPRKFTFDKVFDDECARFFLAQHFFRVNTD